MTDKVQEIMELVDDLCRDHRAFPPYIKEMRAAIESRLREVVAPPVPEPVWLDHIACIEDGVLRFMSGRKAPAHDCELYAMPGGKAAPPLYTAPTEAATPQPAAKQAEPFQQRVAPWMQACFGPAISADKMERNHRFFEESTELVQANGMTRDEAHQLVDYTFDRPVGELHQEVGGVMVTLAALCLASGADMHDAGEVELARIWTKVETIRAKQAAKPKHSPLPAALEAIAAALASKEHP